MEVIRTKYKDNNNIMKLDRGIYDLRWVLNKVGDIIYLIDEEITLQINGIMYENERF